MKSEDKHVFKSLKKGGEMAYPSAKLIQSPELCYLAGYQLPRMVDTHGNIRRCKAKGNYYQNRREEFG